MGYTTVAVAPMVTQTRCGEDVRFLSLNAQRSTLNVQWVGANRYYLRCRDCRWYWARVAGRVFRHRASNLKIPAALPILVNPVRRNTGAHHQA